MDGRAERDGNRRTDEAAEEQDPKDCSTVVPAERFAEAERVVEAEHIAEVQT
jgi:hypothetical protein